MESNKVIVNFTGSVKLFIDQQIEITQQDYDYLNNKDCDWNNINEYLDSKAFNIIMDAINLDNSMIEDLEVDYIYIEKEPW